MILEWGDKATWYHHMLWKAKKVSIFVGEVCMYLETNQHRQEQGSPQWTAEINKPIQSTENLYAPRLMSVFLIYLTIASFVVTYIASQDPWCPKY